MTISFSFDHIGDCEIDVIDISESQEEKFLDLVLGLCNSMFDLVEGDAE